MNPILDAYQSSDLFGKTIFLTLAALSVLTWILFLQKYFQGRVAKKLGKNFQRTFQKLRMNPLGLEVKGGGSHPFTELYHCFKRNSLELLSKNRRAVQEERPVTLSSSDVDLIEAHLQTTISSETGMMEKNLFILSTIVSLAPFLGLLGTVWGILLTFAELQTGASASANSAIMGGLAMALGTTVAGLVVAIPALIAYNYLRSQLSHFHTEMEDFSQLLLASIELQYRQVEIR